MEFQNYYQVLGVSRNIDATKLKAIYRKLSKEYHPDSNLNLPLEEQRKRQEKFKTITNAYSILSDSKKRQEYDQQYDTYLEELLEKCIVPKQKETTTPTVEPKITFADKMSNLYQECKKSYQEVRKQEKKFPFEKRHRKFEHNIYREFYQDDYNYFQELVFVIGKGTAHVFYETLYQLCKLRYIKKDSIPKFVIRNRAGIATVAFVLGFGSTILPPSSKEINASVQEAIEEEILIHQIYQEKDSLENSEQTLVTENYNSNSSVESNSVIISYNIPTEQLDSYTKTQPFSHDLSLEEYAKNYQTDVTTLVSLNRDAIMDMSDKYVVLSDTLTVPDFVAINHSTIKGKTKSTNH